MKNLYLKIPAILKQTLHIFKNEFKEFLRLIFLTIKDK